MCKWGTETVLSLVIPADLSHTGAEYIKEVGVDACIAPLVKALNDAGIRTRTSCCGHGRTLGRIQLVDGRTLEIIGFLNAKLSLPQHQEKPQ